MFTKAKKLINDYRTTKSSQTLMLVVVNFIKKWAWAIIRALLVIGISFVILYPIIIKISAAIMSENDIYDLTVRWIPSQPTFDNFTKAIRYINFWDALRNTVLLSTVCTALQITVCTMASYAFAKLRFPFWKVVFVLMIFTLIVPPQTYMIGTYTQFRYFNPFGITHILFNQAGLLGTVVPFIVKAVLGQGIRCGLYVYIMTQFFRNVPTELEEAAQVDGAGPIKTFVNIMIPNAIPALVTVCVFSFVWQWNDSFFASFFASEMDLLIPNLGRIDKLVRLGSNNTLTTAPELASAAKNAAALLILLPILVLFIFSQRFFVENLERSGIVG